MEEYNASMAKWDDTFLHTAAVIERLPEHDATVLHTLVEDEVVSRTSVAQWGASYLLSGLEKELPSGTRRRLGKWQYPVAGTAH
jgi:hypothetical protein